MCLVDDFVALSKTKIIYWGAKTLRKLFCCRELTFSLEEAYCHFEEVLTFYHNLKVTKYGDIMSRINNGERKMDIYGECLFEVRLINKISLKINSVCCLNVLNNNLFGLYMLNSTYMVF